MTSPGRILVVDDDPEVLDTLRELLEDLGYEATTAPTVEQAITAMASGQPHAARDRHHRGPRA